MRSKPSGGLKAAVDDIFHVIRTRFSRQPGECSDEVDCLFTHHWYVLYFLHTGCRCTEHNDKTGLVVVHSHCDMLNDLFEKK